MMTINSLLCIALTVVALWAVMTRSLLRSAICLAVTSAILTMVMFRLHSPLAAVFELSVCAGLIPVIFVSAITLTHPLTPKEVIQYMKERLNRFWYLPFIVLSVGIIFIFIHLKFKMPLSVPEVDKDVRFVLWHLRPLDLIGQILILLVGVFGILVLFKEKKENE
jgi:NADH-quinone oxidoreductase subunit J